MIFITPVGTLTQRLIFFIDIEVLLKNFLFKIENKNDRMLTPKYNFTHFSQIAN